MKKLITRIFIGAKKGLLTPTLPDHITALNNKPMIRIFRVVGGISTVLILTHRLAYLGEGLPYSFALTICTIFSILLALYLIFITYHRIRHMITIIKRGDLDIRNSPLDKTARNSKEVSSKILSSLKELDRARGRRN